jgi:hypothetical protein
MSESGSKSVIRRCLLNIRFACAQKVLARYSQSAQAQDIYRAKVNQDVPKLTTKAARHIH